MTEPSQQIYSFDSSQSADWQCTSVFRFDQNGNMIDSIKTVDTENNRVQVAVVDGKLVQVNAK